MESSTLFKRFVKLGPEQLEGVDAAGKGKASASARVRYSGGGVALVGVH